MSVSPFYPLVLKLVVCVSGTGREMVEDERDAGRGMRERGGSKEERGRLKRWERVERDGQVER